MADDGQLTPEKQLLKLIENSKDIKGPGLKQARIRHAGSGLLSFGALRGALFGHFSFFKRSTKKKLAAPRRRINIAAVNRMLALAVFCLVVYVLGDTLAAAFSMQRPPNLSLQKDKIPAPRTENVSPLKESAYYLQKVASRDLFKEGRPVKKEANREVASPQENAAVSSLSLVGISWSQNPDVIIEDKSKQRTFFVKRGQTVGDGVKVEAIFKDHVVLNYEGQEFELR